MKRASARVSLHPDRATRHEHDTRNNNSNHSRRQTVTRGRWSDGRPEGNSFVSSRRILIQHYFGRSLHRHRCLFVVVVVVVVVEREIHKRRNRRRERLKRSRNSNRIGGSGNNCHRSLESTTSYEYMLNARRDKTKTMIRFSDYHTYFFNKCYIFLCLSFLRKNSALLVFYSIITNLLLQIRYVVENMTDNFAVLYSFGAKAKETFSVNYCTPMSLHATTS